MTEKTVKAVVKMLSEAGYFVGIAPDNSRVYYGGPDDFVDDNTTIAELVELLEK